MRRLFGSLAVFVLLGAAAYAQAFRGAINGTVNDPSGAVLAGATVKAANVATSVLKTALATSDGEFAFQDLPLGASAGALFVPSVSCFVPFSAPAMALFPLICPRLPVVISPELRC